MRLGVKVSSSTARQLDRAQAFAVAWFAKLRDRANSIQQQKGGLYTGHHDCVRSVFCNLDAGSPEHAQMCFGCTLLLSNRWYQEIDKSGIVLEGYQNKECTAYFLPHDNGGWGVSIRVGEQPAGHLPCPPLSSPRQEPHLQTPSSRQEDCHRSNERQKVRQRK
jgi:hypothetical protein